MVEMHWRYFMIAALALLPEMLGGCGRRIGDASGATAASASASQLAAASAPVDAAASPPLPTEQRFSLRDGRTVVVDSDDHVRVLTVDGGVSDESWCGANGISYPKAKAFLEGAVRLIQAADRRALVELVKFPLHASPPVKTRAEFLDHYAQLFPPSEVVAISRADPAAVFCRNGAFSLGDGEIWGQPDEAGVYRITAINPPISKPRQ